MSKFSCVKCGDKCAPFEDPIEHFQQEHPGIAERITMGDIWNQTKLVFSDRGRPVREPKDPKIAGQQALV